jgi:catechol 2,3-dioxygenase-like lactoylglutathione lyase family enzyme
MIRVSDDQSAKAFYIDVLGFEQINEAGDPVAGSGIFRAGGAQIFLHAWDGAGEAWDNWRAYFYVDDQPALVACLAAQKAFFKGPTDTDYGMCEVELSVPDGNVLCFGTDMPTNMGVRA